jgi:uncharacterized protein DUF6544
LGARLGTEVEQLLERVRRFAMPDGDVAPRDVRFAQDGEMRLAPDQPWRKFRAEQWTSGASIDFSWRAWVGMAPFAPVRVVDRFERGNGALTVSAFGLLPIARGRGPEIDRGEVLRALAELPWRPFAFRQMPHATWEAAGVGALRATFDDGRTKASAVLEIDGEGRVMGGSADRPRLDGKSVVETKWSGAFGDYRTFGRVRIPTSAEVAWRLPDGPFKYWRGRVVAFPEW